MSESSKICKICKMIANDFFWCAQCKNVWYCSKKCQNRDWNSHKLICGKETQKYNTQILLADKFL